VHAEGRRSNHITRKRKRKDSMEENQVDVPTKSLDVLTGGGGRKKKKRGMFKRVKGTSKGDLCEAKMTSATRQISKKMNSIMINSRCWVRGMDVGTNYHDTTRSGWGYNKNKGKTNCGGRGYSTP